MIQASRQHLAERKNTYLASHYMNLHAALIGVTVAVAGLAASNILLSQQLRSIWPLALIFWVASLLITANVYMGMMVGALVLPSTMPDIGDLLLPLAIGVGEFLLFGLFAIPSPDAPPTSALIIAWFSTFSATALFAALAITRARSHIRLGNYTPDLSTAIEKYLERLKVDMRGASICGTIGAAGVITQLLPWTMVSTTAGYASAGLCTLGLVYGLYAHHQTASGLATAVDTETQGLDENSAVPNS